MSAQTAVLLAWVVWYSTWIATVVWSGRTTVQMGRDRSGWHRALATFGVLLLFTPSLGTFARPLVAPMWSETAVVQWALLAW